MTKNTSSEESEEQREQSWEQTIVKYLNENPDFFERYPGVLEDMQLSHPESGEAISLIERQVRVLREKKVGADRQLRELVSIARENDVLSNRLHHFALSMIDAGSIEDALDTAHDLLRSKFRIDETVILLARTAGSTDERPEFVSADNQYLEALLKRLKGKKPLCGAKMDAPLMNYLFSANAGNIRSTAIVRLQGNAVSGVLCLGSQLPQRFDPDMGTVFLTKLAELLMRSLDRFLK
jgi:uncharacterized protein